MKKLIVSVLCAMLPVHSAQASNIIWVSLHPADDSPSANAATAGFTMAPDVGYTDLLAANGHPVMNTNPANVLGGHRMVFLTGSRGNGMTSEGAGIGDLTPTGTALFPNAVDYMAIPEPGTAALLALGALGALIAPRRRT